MAKNRGICPAQIHEQLGEIKAAGLLRSRRTLNSPQSTRINLDTGTLLNFCSNDYLGLASDPRLISALQEGAQEYGVGSGASPLVCGYSRAHEKLEKAVAGFCGRDRAILFSSGYLANLAIAATFTQGREDRVYLDRLNHASIIDAAMLAKSRWRRYPHADTASLQSSLKGQAKGCKLVFTDGVFSMDGDRAPLEELARLSKEFAALLVVDDAHGFGVSGKQGGGSLEELALDQQCVPLLVATFGKAIGAGGAFIAGREDLIELLVQKARTYIYSTALSPALATAALAGLDICAEESWRRERLLQLVQHFREAAARAGLPLASHLSPIQPLVLGDDYLAVAMSQALEEEGMLVSAIRPPTVPRGTARLRITFSASHSVEDVDRLVSALQHCWARRERLL